MSNKQGHILKDQRITLQYFSTTALVKTASFLIDMCWLRPLPKSARAANGWVNI